MRSRHCPSHNRKLSPAPPGLWTGDCRGSCPGSVSASVCSVPGKSLFGGGAAVPGTLVSPGGGRPVLHERDCFELMPFLRPHALGASAKPAAETRQPEALQRQKSASWGFYAPRFG